MHGMNALNSDQRLYVWHIQTSPGRPGANSEQRLVLIVSTHVDDLKVAGDLQGPFSERTREEVRETEDQTGLFRVHWRHA